MGLDLYELRKLQSNFPIVKITKSSITYDLVMNFYGDDIDIYESVFILLLNNSNNSIGYAKISQGGITGTVVDVRLVAKYAVDSLATSVILCHNHPSGVLSPSSADKAITKKVKDGLALLDVRLLDHLIITSSSYFSFLDEGLI